jgi:diaminohydroxyphosphoribosylaminopyrimidine deaminase/5-amino-6-(5-phosphoribosylamino)uracil reductase
MKMDEKYMARCLELAAKGAGSTAPNPMVGCVIVHEERIIGEGYHRAVGEAHAEVNAIASVKDPRLLASSTLYVNLEPCSYHGRTPPCSDLIVEKKIPRVVVGVPDPNPLVAGNGLRHLEKKGVEVAEGILEKECHDLNIRFITFHQKKRPWVVLKWAQSEDGFIDRVRKAGEPAGVNWITGTSSRQLVHKWRSEEQAVMVGTGTALADDPELTVRDWNGKNPLRIVIDRGGKLPGALKLFNDDADTLVLTSDPPPSKYAERSSRGGDGGRVRVVPVPGGEDYISFILKQLHEMDIISLMVEGGTALLNSFIRSGTWDEARVFTGKMEFGNGLPAPVLEGEPVVEARSGEDLIRVYRNS